jgi:hypothetical protein
VLQDPGGKDVGMPNPPFNENDTSGWDIKDCYYHYNRSSDTMYVGLDFYGIAGDADGDGDPSHTSDRLASKFGLDWPYVFSWPASRLAFGDNSILSVPKLPVLS